jgi:hypothetical protein
MGFDPGELGRMMGEAGLSPSSNRPLPPEPGVKGPALFLLVAAA